MNLIKICLLCAVVLQSASGGAQTLQTLVSFNGTNGGYQVGNPYAALTMGVDGNFYGTTEYGGTTNSTFPTGMGTVFKITTNGTLTTLVFFNYNSGANPYAALTLGSDGNLYGTTTSGGSYGFGTVFQVKTNGTLTALVSFAGSYSQSKYGVGGENPEAPLTLDPSGKFFGTTAGGGLGFGTAFQVTTNGQFQLINSFTGPSQDGGASPSAALTLGNDGNYYGTTSGGGYNYGGTMFQWNMQFNEIIPLLYFNSSLGNPSAALTLGKDGSFYVTTGNGGSYGLGAIYKATTNGGLYTPALVSFNGTNGANPCAALTFGNDGKYYGTTAGGGSSGDGTLFQMTTNGTLTTLVSFNGSNGLNPQASLTLGNDGNFYGMTPKGGSNGYGTIFRLLLSPFIATQPVSLTNYAGMTAMFTVIATNLFPVSYQWKKNGTNLVDSGNISGSATNILTITGISDNDTATYSVIVSNFYGTASSSATLTVVDSPGITAQPQSQAAGVGSNVTFSATAYGAQPLVFQWYFNNSPVGSPTTGANVSSYTLMGVQTNQSGNYSVQVFNGYDSATSSNAVLTVAVFAPSITTQPTNQTVLLGRSASFSVSANGSAPFQYQWLFNSTNIPGATKSIYMIPAVAATNTGNYSVIVTNSAGGVTSSNALLTVIVPPVVSFQFLAGYPQLNLIGMLSSNFTVQYSTNLAGTNWINLRSISNLSANPYQFLDPAGSGQPARFYRAVMQ